jgi:2-oxoglutarate dehydrogenase E1 component
MDRNGNNGWAQFSGLNSAYIEEMFERYRGDPGSVDPETRSFFELWGPPAVATAAVAPSRSATPAADALKIAATIALGTAIRMYGHHAAQLDPLGGEPTGDTALMPATHGLKEEDLVTLPASAIGGDAARNAANALDAIRRLREVYQGTSGFEFEHISNAEERDWLFEAVESGRFRPPKDPIDDRRLLERMTQVEALERFLQNAFPTQTRFSIEGLDILVPVLDELVAGAARVGTKSVILGMAHRGRLNVLAHVLEMPYETIIAEFRGALRHPDGTASGGGDLGWTGDVKYHLGAGTAVDSTARPAMRILMPSNPSHLEFIDPVVEGMTRAVSERRDSRGPAQLDEVASLAVLAHGDAAFPGEGVVAETLNLSRLPGYRTGGTVHIIENNQLGFTTPPEFTRSTLFASDLAKGFELPIIHVNADDAEACIAAIRLAHAYLHKFRKDVLVDLIGYRRYGHNEGDEPSFTQPRTYEAVARHPAARAILAEEMLRQGKIGPGDADVMLKDAIDRLQMIRQSLPDEAMEEPGKGLDQAGLEAGGTVGGLGHSGPASEVETTLPAETVVRLNQELLDLPPDFHLHPKLKPLFERRRTALSSENGTSERGRIDWGHAETLALASILMDGTPIRITGEDTARGTFSQRHLVLHDVDTGATYVPLQNIASARVAFDVWDSPLTEQATLGFEYGYNIQAPEVLLLWEAQYGDFVNGGQVIIDTFISSARSKWAENPSLVLLLPHAYEGQGPEHSSARLERFLQLAAEDNLRVANCTTAAQYFHILRRQSQLLKLDPRPLVLLTPKSLLRHPMASSSLEDLVHGRFMPVMDDSQARQQPETIRRLILCSGHVYVDLATARQVAGASGVASSSVALVRMEELYPFPVAELERVISGYPALEEIVWAQEEPRNMGAWPFVAPRLRDLTGGRLPLLYAGRTRRASPAEGSQRWHLREQRRLVQAAFEPSPEGVKGAH